LDRKLEEYNQTLNKRFLSFEDEFQRTLNKITANVEVGPPILEFKLQAAI